MKQVSDIYQILDFLSFARRLMLVYRQTPKPNAGFENDAEHTYMLALSCLLFADLVAREQDRPVNMAKLLKMALIHDLAEIITQDTATWDDQARIEKYQHELDAIQQLCAHLPSDLSDEIISLWIESEAQISLEAKLVKSLDRLDPVMHRVFFDIGWHDVDPDHRDVSKLDSRQLPRHSFSPTITTTYQILRQSALDSGLISDDTK
jgi:putative hydrolases of HD superfamily